MRFRRSAVAVVAVGMLALALQWTGQAGAQGTGTNLSLRGLTPFLAAGDTVFELELAVTPPPLAPVYVRIDRFDDISNNANPRGQLDAWLAGRRSTIFETTAPVPFDGSRLRVPITRDSRSKPSEGLRITDAGVFPLVIRLETADGKPVDDVQTFLIRLPEDGGQPPLRVAPVVGLRAPVALKLDGTRQLGAADTARLQETQSLLAGHPSAKLTVDPQPETIAALDPANPALNPATLYRAIGNRTVLSPTYVDIDVTQFVDANLRDQVQRQRLIGRDALVQVFKQKEEAFDTATMLARHPLSAPARAALQTTQPAPVTRLVVPAGGIGPVDARATAGSDADLQPFTLAHAGGRSGAVLWDERLSGRLKATGDPVLDAQTTLADLAILACGRTGKAHCNSLPAAARGIALVVPDEQGAVVAFDQVLDVLGAKAPWILDVTDLGGLFALNPATLPRSTDAVVRDAKVSPSPDRDLTGYAWRLNEVANRVGAYREMLTPPPAPVDPGAPAPPPEPLVDGQPLTTLADQLDQLLDVAGADAPARSDAYFDEVARRVDARLSGIRTPAHEPITLTSADGEVQVRIENRLPHPVTVQVEVASDKPVFPEGQPNSSTRFLSVVHRLPAATESGPSAFLVPVKIEGLTSGTSPLDVRVLSPDGNVVLGTTRIEVRSTVVSGVGLVLTLAAGLFLVVWWARHFRDARRARKLVEVEDVEEAVAMVTGEVPVITGHR